MAGRLDNLKAGFKYGWRHVPIAKLLKYYDLRTPPSPSPGPVSGPAASGTPVVDLLAKLRQPDPPLALGWRATPQGLEGDGFASALDLRHVPPDEYDLHLTFQFGRGAGGMKIGLMAGRQAFGVSIRPGVPIASNYATPRRIPRKPRARGPSRRGRRIPWPAR